MCPEGFVRTPSHRGYDYLGEDLAARGYFVVSINTNRGINGLSGPSEDPRLLRARGRLLLRHLEQLSRWDDGRDETPAELGVDLRDRIDFSEVGLLGHSRGGEGVRIAYDEYRRSGSPWPLRIGAPLSFRGIFEIGPTDFGLADQPINATELPWNVLLPACDWDLSDLRGVRPFDRMLRITEQTPRFKSFYHVWGANHNYYNSEWHNNDGNISGLEICRNHTPLFDPADFGSELQRETGRFAISAFFTANVGLERDEAANAVFDPAFPLPVEYRVNRGYHPGGDTALSLVLEDFTGPTGTSSYGLPNQTGGNLSVSHQTLIPPHDPSLRAAQLQSFTASDGTFFQTNFAPSGEGFDLTSYDLLDLRVDRSLAPFDPPSAPIPVSFLIRLVNADDSLSEAVSLDDLLEVLPPPRMNSGRTLQTVRIPLASFAQAQLDAVRAVRLSFTTPLDEELTIWISNIRATRATTAAAATARGGVASSGGIGAGVANTGPVPGVIAPARITLGNSVVSIASQGPDSVAITLTSDVFFEARGSALVLSVGAEQSDLVQHPDGDLHTARFILTREAFERLGEAERLSVDYGASSPSVWDFGTLDKALLDR
jgi:hypothetical protein